MYTDFPHFSSPSFSFPISCVQYLSRLHTPLSLTLHPDAFLLVARHLIFYWERFVPHA
jgi:hypothetical protein